MRVHDPDRLSEMTLYVLNRKNEIGVVRHDHRYVTIAPITIDQQATVPVVVDAGLGAPSQAAEAMEMGADAVLVNTAIAIASDPVRMAQAFKKAIEAGREAHEIGLGEKQWTASTTSPLTSFFSNQSKSD